MSVLGFTGLATFEIVWGARVLKVLFGGQDSIYYFAIVILAFYLVLYLFMGGQRGAINTDQYQLVIAYVGLHAMVAWAIWQGPVSFSGMDAPIIVPLILVSGFVMLGARVWWAWHESKAGKLAKALNIITVISLGGMLLALLCRRELYSLATFSWKTIDKSSPEFGWQLAAFSVLPLLFQFVDMTNWQRIAAIKEQPGKPLLRGVLEGLIQYLIESPLSWLLPVLMGLCAAQFLGKNAQGEPWDLFLAKAFAEPGILGPLLSAVIVAGIAAVFLSTADGLLSAVGYSFAYDIRKRTRLLVDRSSDSVLKAEEAAFVIAKGRMGMAVLLMITAVAFVLVDVGMKKGMEFLGLFLAMFTPMVSFAPAIVVPALTKRAAPATAAWLAIGGGGLAGIGLGVVSVFKGGIWQWGCIVAAFGVSWFFYLVGMIWSRKVGVEGGESGGQ
jgi:Na+/proline symporter